ncbi:hypothetical protein E2986_12293, partial [Frieseomelitta varia]
IVFLAFFFFFYSWKLGPSISSFEFRLILYCNFGTKNSRCA